MSNAPIPALPSLASIDDPNVRMALQSLYDAWKVRNGDVGDGSNKFLTTGDLLEGFKSINISGGVTNAFSNLNPETVVHSDGWVRSMLQTVDNYIQQSRLWKELNTELSRIDTSVIDEAESRVTAIQQVSDAIVAEASSRVSDIQQVFDELSAEASARLAADTANGSSINAIQEVNATQATQISGLTTRIGSAESDIVNLESTTASQATSLTSLTSRVGTTESNIGTLQTTTATQANSLTSLTSRVGSAESNISTLQTTTSGQATSITNLTTTVGQRSRVFAQAAAPASDASYTLRVNDLWYDTDDQNKHYRWSGSAWVDLTDTRLLTAGSNITSLQSTTASQATALTNLTTRVSTAESDITSLETTTSTQAQSLSSLTTRVGTAESNISTLNTTTASQANSLTLLTSRVSTTESAISSEATARANGDTALTNSLNTQVATINGNISSLQTSYNNLATTTGVNSSAITSLQTSVNGVNTVAQSGLSLAQTTSNSVNGSWTVKFDADGYVVGAGLGLEGKNGTYTSTFGVIADRFFIAKPGGVDPVPMLEAADVNGVNVLAFKGVIAGASGYFSGDLDAAGGTFRGSLNAATGTFAGVLQAGVVDITKLQGYSETRSSPGVYDFTISADYPQIRYQLIGGGGGGGVGDYGEWNTPAGPGGGGGAGQYLLGTTGSFPEGTIIRVSVGVGGSAGTEWQQSGGNGGATTIQYKTPAMSSFITIVTADYGRGGACAPDAYYDNADGDTRGGAGGFGYPEGSSGWSGEWGYPGSTAAGGNGASSLWGGGGQGVWQGQGGSATGHGAGGAGGGFHPGWRFNSWHNTGKYNGWYPGGAGSGGRMILEFFNPNAVVLRSEFTQTVSNVITLQQDVSSIKTWYATRTYVDTLNNDTRSWVSQNFAGNCACTNCQCK